MKRAPRVRTRPNQRRGQNTREKLVLAAVRALSENNIYGFRLSHVAKIAKVPQPLVDYHFESLEALLMAMVLFQLQKLKTLSIEAIEKNSMDPRQALAAYIRVPFELSSTDHGFRAVWSSYYHLAVVSRPFADLNKGVRETGHDRIQMLIQNIIVREARTTKAPRHLTSEVATAIQGLITGCGFMASAETGGNFKLAAEIVVNSANQLIDGHFSKGV